MENQRQVYHFPTARFPPSLKHKNPGLGFQPRPEDFIGKNSCPRTEKYLTRINGEWSETKVGTPQGSVVSPLLANVYLHYVFDLWIEAWRKKVARGKIIVVRYADDLVVGFESRAEAELFLKAFKERMAKFGLELNAEKTRLIEFGRFAARNREQRGEGKPETCGPQKLREAAKSIR